MEKVNTMEITHIIMRYHIYIGSSVYDVMVGGLEIIVFTLLAAIGLQVCMCIMY